MQINIADLRKGELHENTVRKDFLASELAAIIEEVESEKSLGRPKKTENKNGAESAQFPKGRTVEVVAELADKILSRRSRKLQKLRKRILLNLGT